MIAIPGLIGKNSMLVYVLSAVLLASLLNTDLFSNKSLTAFYGYSLCAALFSLLAGIMLLSASKKLAAHLPMALFICWAVYVGIDGYLPGHIFNHNHTYILINCVLFVAVCLVVQTGMLNFNLLLKVVNFIAFAEAALCIIQFIGIAETPNNYFRATGSWVNPNVTAMFLAMAVPAVFYFLVFQEGKWRRVYLLNLVTVITALGTLQCRTAFIGVLVSVTIILQPRYQLLQWFRSHFSLYARTFIAMAATIILLVAGNYAYHIKKASADGRKLVWKLTADMIMQKPWTGYGYGAFEVNYNVRQASYFQHNQGTVAEAANASYVNMAYNEPLQHTAEGGLIGLLLFLAVTGCFLLYPLLTKAKDNGVKMADPTTLIAYAAIVSFVVMGLLNFIIEAIPAMCLFIIYAAFLGTRPAYTINQYLRPAWMPMGKSLIAGIGLAITGTYFFIVQTLVVNAQLTNARAQHLNKQYGYQDAEALLMPLATTLKASESYWNNYGNALYGQKKFTGALDKFNKAQLLSAHPDLLIRTGRCYEAMKQYGNAQQQFKLAAGIEPGKLAPVYASMLCYVRSQDTARALQAAKELITRQPKVPSAKADRYKKQAGAIIKYYQTTNSRPLL